jgi:hypothetical protein
MPVPALPLVNDPPVPIVQEAEWASGLAWTQRLEEKSFASAGDRTTAVHSVTLTELPQLHVFSKTLRLINVVENKAMLKNFSLR